MRSPQPDRASVPENGNRGPDPITNGRRAAATTQAVIDRNEASRFPFEKQQFDRQQHRRDRCAEDRCHSGRRASDEQGLALRCAQAEALGEQRANSAAGHDDGAFGAERTASADRNGGGQRLEHSHLRGHAALADQNRLDRFRNPVSADFLRAKASHQADDKSAQRRSRDHQPARFSVRERHRFDAERVEPDQIGCERNGAQQHLCWRRRRPRPPARPCR